MEPELETALMLAGVSIKDAAHLMKAQVDGEQVELERLEQVLSTLIEALGVVSSLVPLDEELSDSPPQDKWVRLEAHLKVRAEQRLLSRLQLLQGG